MLRPLIIACTLCIATGATAQEEALYDPEPPPGAAYVRVVNLTGSGEVAEVTIAGVSVGAIGDLEASPYVVVEDRDTAVTVGPAEASAAIEPGRFYSVIARPGADGIALTTLEDPPNTDRTKAQLALYNLTGQTDVDLVTADGKVVVFDDVPPDGADYRKVNAVTIGLAVKVNGEVIRTFDAVALQRGSVFGFLIAEAGGLDAGMVRAETRQ